ncbi:MAG: hypothetical protein JNK07_11175 [Alphaproteobacteria bacterium]|nr:hypothetical protein [Alphaproteobacteria bacterium]
MVLRLFVALIVLAFVQPAWADQTWRVTKSAWTEEDERGYSAFIQRIGESGCETPDDCINSDANPYRGTDGKGINFNADCADLIYMLRAYYAWKNGLPFTYTTGVYSRGGRDFRFSPKGNRVAGRRNITGGVSGRSVIYAVRDAVSSASYRIGPDIDENPITDLYPVKIQPGSIRPGTAIYDVNGHVAMVYKVGEDGRIHYMDAHPDFTLTRSVYGAQFGRDNPAMGAGFKNFRPIRVHKGRIELAKNNQIADYSMEQFYGNVDPTPRADWRAGKFNWQGLEVGYYEYVRIAMAGGKLSFNPVAELKATMKTLCNDLYDRQRFVELAIEAGVDRKPHPERLPPNIYGTDQMEWEIYSTPSRDARLKTAFKAFREDMQRLIGMWMDRDPRISYDGLNLKADLQEAYDRAADLCTVVYRNSAGTRVTLRYPQLVERLFKMSFDPYDCIERRWGAMSAEELASCSNTPAKNRWYEAMQRLRNQIDRTYETRMDFTVRDLEAKVPGSGSDIAPDVDTKRAIDNIGYRTPVTTMQPPGY